MKKFLCFLIFCWVMFSGFATDPLSKSSTTVASTDFKMVKSENDITIYTRWIPVNETRSARQLKAEFFIPEPVDQILSVLRDDTHTTSWMRNTKTYYRVKTMDQRQWYSYVQFAVPWPLSNQDCILKYQVIVDPSSQNTRIEVVGVPDYLKEFEGVKRIAHMEVEWVFTRVNPSLTKVEYYAFSNQPSRYPRSITDPIIQNNLLKTMKAFCCTVSERR